ncbi:MAG TPA: class II aldolase/adducin family protein, partial [Candidatus Binatia bacterium]
ALLSEKTQSCLLRGRGNVVVGKTLQQVVYRTIQTQLNARLQLQATMLVGPLIYMRRRKPRR